MNEYGPFTIVTHYRIRCSLHYAGRSYTLAALKECLKSLKYSKHPLSSFAGDHEEKESLYYEPLLTSVYFVVKIIDYTLP